MKAAVVEQLRKARVMEVPDPELIPGSIKVKIQACAICGSDLRIYTKGDPRATFPRIIGHEIAGTIVEIGAGVSGFTVGDRICIAPGHGCGECFYCKHDMGNVCINPQPSIGYASSGGFAQFIVPPVTVVKNGFVNKIPDNLTYEEASMSELLACCINGQERVHVGKGDTVLIIGPGPAGCMHIQLAKSRGAKKVFISGHESPRLERTKRFAPDQIFTEQGDALVNRVLRETGGIGVDVVIVAAPSSEAQALALRLAAPRGRIDLFGGLSKENRMVMMDNNIIHYKELLLTGASSSLGRQNKEAIELLSSRQIDPGLYITHRFSLDDFSRAFETVEKRECIKAVILPWA
jgi:L-iditol 2-dehydrogenase